MALTPGQEKCINTLDRSLVVAAGAGSGKTYTLTKRIVKAIQDGNVDGIQRVCAITFTNKAAGELKARIKSELRACNLVDQALKVDEAWVSTIHGMCARILRAHAVELDLDPKFEMADAEQVRRMQSRAIDDVLAAAQAGERLDEEWPDRDAVDALFAEYPARSYGPRGTSVESMVTALMGIAGGHADGFDAIAAGAVSIRPERVVLGVVESFEDLAGAARAQKPNESREAFAALVDELAAAMRSQLESGQVDAPAALAMLDKLPTPKKVGTADYKEQVAAVLDRYRMSVMELRLAAAAPHLQTLVALSRCAMALFDAAKRREGVLDNDDLLVMASRAIATRPEIAAQYADKFQLVMVDEFQDTDQMQVDMIKKLAGPGACRLCTVGDAQQSIYRFRGADVSVYRRHLESVRATDPDDVIMLPDNFRSHPDVLSLVDRVFERSDMFGGEFMSLAPGRDESRVKAPFTEGVPRVQVQLTTKPYRGVSSERMREVAADRIAAAFADLHERGHSAGQMAVLLSGMTHADVYAAALRRRGLACVIAGGSVFVSSPEAAVVLDLAHVIANPYQTQSLFNVLTSPLFMLEAGDLLELGTAEDPQEDSRGPQAYRRRNLCSGLLSCARLLSDGEAPDAWSPKLRLALRVMGDVIDSADRAACSSVIQRAVAESGWLARLEAQGAEGLASAGNVYKAIRMIQSIEASQACGPARTASLFQGMLEESKEAPGALSASDGDFVRIMTVHASKGLEFPIVAIGEFQASSGSSSKLLAHDVDGRVMLSLDLANTVSGFSGSANVAGLPALYASLMADCADEDELLAAARDASGALELRAALYEHDRRGDEEEAKRLLYVALTRAKEALVVSLMGTRTKDNPNGTPKGCMQALVDALAGDGAGFDAGVSHVPFGGTADALVDHVALQPAESDDCAEASTAVAHADDVQDSASGSGQLFFVPAANLRTPFARVPRAHAHEGIFSYSSISEASHEGDVLAVLADAHCAQVDVPGQALEGSAPQQGAPERDEGSSDDAWRGAAAVAFVGEDDGTWGFAGASMTDSDKATDLGTAFHRLAQYAVVTRDGAGALAYPPEDRVDALSRAGNLDSMQRFRLDEALDRWFNSDIAREMAAFADLRAEAPFFVALPDAAGDGQVFLEGEIDLIGLDECGAHARVVDYKTGGRDDEEADALRQKHVLQAACYAYAIMLQGVQSVEAVFVRVERPRPDDPTQPQCVRYRFTQDDLPALARTIAQVHANAH